MKLRHRAGMVLGLTVLLLGFGWHQPRSAALAGLTVRLLPNHRGVAWPLRRAGHAFDRQVRHPDERSDPTWTSFAALSNDMQAQHAAPADTQVAAGPTDLMQLVNSTAAVWSKSGQLIKSWPLTQFFGVSAGSHSSDSQILYDPGSDRWFATTMVETDSESGDGGGNSQVLIAASPSSDPTAAWTVYLLTSKSGVVMDQPMLGVSSDTLTLSWDDGQYQPSGDGQYLGEETWVVDKGELLQGRGLHYVQFGPDQSKFRVVPARSAAPTDTQYLAYDKGPTSDGSGSQIGVMTITGTPGDGNVALNETDVPVRTIGSPPGAQQPGGGPLIDTDRATPPKLLSAVWQNDTMWLAANAACLPAGDSQFRSCLRLIELSTGGTTPATIQDFDVGQPGMYFYYPAVALDSAGDMVTVFTESSATVFPSVATVEQPTSSTPGTIGGVTALQAGAGMGVYDCGSCFTSERNGVRWGDYSGAAADPSDPSTVWVAGEYAASNTDVTDWGTAIGPIDFASGAAPGSTETSIPSTATGVPSPAATLIPTSTPIPPFTPATSTPLPTPTATVTPSSTPVRPTGTASRAQSTAPTPSARRPSRRAATLPISAHLSLSTVRRGEREFVTVSTLGYTRIVIRVLYPVHGGFHTHGVAGTNGLWTHQWTVAARHPGVGTIALLIIRASNTRHYTIHFRVQS